MLLLLAVFVTATRVRTGRVPASEAERTGQAPSVSEARRRAERLRRNRAAQLAASMVDALPPPEIEDPEAVHEATAHKLSAEPTAREEKLSRRRGTKPRKQATPEKVDPADQAPAPVEATTS